MADNKQSYTRAELAQVIVDEMYQLVGILDGNGINLESNHTSLEAAGLKREDVVGKYFWETPWWPEDVRPKLKDAVLRASKGEFVRFEIENKVKDGMIYVDFSLKPVKDQNGIVQFIIPEGRDITSRKIAEEEVRKKNEELNRANALLKEQEVELRKAHAAVEKALLSSEERLTLAMETAGLGFWDLNLETNALYWDSTIQKMFGFLPGEFTGKIEQFYGRIHEADRNLVENQVLQAIHHHSHFTVEYRVIWPLDQSLHYVLSKGKVIVSDGKAVRFLGVAIEVTERKEIEQVLETQFHELAESMPQIVFVKDDEGLPLYFNQKWFTYTGQKELMDDLQAWKTLIHPDDYASFVKQLELARDRKTQNWELEFRLKNADGVYHWHLGRAVPSFDSEGKLSRWYGTMTDIDEQKNIQLELSKAVRIRDDFLFIASHELKTPLTSLKLQLDLQARRLLKAHSERELKSTENAKEQVQRLTRLIDDMLDVGRITSGKLSLRPEDFSLNKLVCEIFDRFHFQFIKAGSETTIDCHVEVKGHWDRFRIEQVILNLFTNAIKYGKGKPVQIRVYKERDRAVISVKDQGIGISPENQKRIFEQFERAVTKESISGLGLGLYISREIVEMHGGTIRVESELGTGSTFFVELPLKNCRT